MKKIELLVVLIFSGLLASGQIVGTELPKNISRSGRYLFYLHGQIVTELGNNAVNPSAPEWGPYAFQGILDSLRKRGFNVISEARKKGTANAFYVDKIITQINKLLSAGVAPGGILVVGASAGSDIALRVSAQMRNESLHYVIMGACFPDTYKHYEGIELYGKFLSVIETSDPHGTCNKMFEDRGHVRHYKEVKLNTGLSHGFIYNGYRAWIDPIVSWMGQP